jgi:D-hexose-6-phosphate mutarotase
VDQAKDGSVTVRLRLPDIDATGPFEMFAAEFVVTMSDTLTTELRVTNQSPDQPMEFEECLHTYFHVGDISQVSVLGLKGLDYLDKPSGFARRKQEDAAVGFDGEVDRVYLNAPPKLEIRDEALGRRIRIETLNANSAVVWNPWVDKARAMEDFGDEEFRHMVCVESGNVHDNGLTLEPGATSTLTVRLSTAAL